MHSGMYALQESVRQLPGTAAAQVLGARISVAHGVGGMFAASGAIIMGNEAPEFQPKLHSPVYRALLTEYNAALSISS